MPPSFLDVYKEQCQKFYVCPRQTVISKILRDGSLDIMTDVMRTDDWKPLLEAVRLDRSLTKIKLASSFVCDYPAIIADVSRLQLIRKIQKDVHIPPLLAPEIFKVFCSSVCEHLKANRALRTLTLQGFPFAMTHIQQVSMAIHESKSLVNLSFEGCPLGQQHLEAICHGLQGSHKPRVLSFSSCQIDCASAEALASLLQLQVMQFHGKAWQDGLPEQPLALDAFRGLCRLTLCSNPLGDEGVAVLLAALKDDLWVKALDLQNCGIGNAGATAVLNFLDENHTLEVVDLRRNPSIDSALSKAVMDKLQENCKGKKCKFKLLLLEKTCPMRPGPQRVRSRSAGCCDRGMKHCGKKQPRSQSAERNQELVQKRRTRLLSPAPVGEQKPKHNPICQPKPQLKQCLPVSFSGEVPKLQKQLLFCQENLKREQEMRLHAEKLLLKMFEENRQLRAENKSLKPNGYTLVECALLEAVEDTFVKFYQLLEILRKNSRSAVQQRQEQHEAFLQRSETGCAPSVHMKPRHATDAGIRKRQPASSCQTGPVVTTVNGVKPPRTAEGDRHVSIHTGLLQDFISNKAQKLAAELRTRWNKRGSTSQSLAEGINAKHLSHEEQPGIRDLVFPIEGRTSTAPLSNEGGKGNVLETASPAASQHSLGLSQNELYAQTFREDPKHLSKLLNIKPVPSKLVPSAGASKASFPLGGHAADYRSDDFESSVSARTSAGSGSTRKEQSFSEKKTKEVSLSAVSMASESRLSIRETLSGKLCTTSNNDTDSVSTSSKTVKMSQTTSMVSSLNEEVASVHTTSLSHQLQQPANAVPIMVRSYEGTATTADTQKVSFPGRQAIPLSVTPSISLSQGASESFDIATADITVSSTESYPRHTGDRNGWSVKCHQQVARTLVVSSRSVDNGNMLGELDAMRTPPGVTLSRNHSSVSTPSSPDTLTSLRLVGSDFDGF